jgi:energy-converting hydrogenase A subunit R
LERKVKVAGNIYVTNCEGPVSMTDSTREIVETFLPEGGKLFTLLDKFDEYLGEIERSTGYQSGGALRYILPFLKAAGVTDTGVREFWTRHIQVMTGVKEIFASIQEKMKTYIVSSSYVHYIEEIGKYLGLDPDHTYSTQVFFDDYEMGEKEQKMFTGLMSAFLQLPPVSWNEAGVVPPEGQFSIDSLKTFLLERLSTLSVNQWLKGIHPVSGAAKADAVIDIAKRNNVSLETVIYVGENTTDVKALSLVREQGGLSISYNGNREAVLNAGYIVVSKDTDVLKDIALTFSQSGKKGIKEGTTPEGAFVCSRANCDIDNVVFFSENMRKELQGRPAAGSPE